MSERAGIKAGLWLTLVAVIAANTAIADEASWQKAMDRGVKAYKAGAYSEAISAFEIAVRDAERSGLKSSKIASSLNNLAMLHHKQGRYAEAEPLYQRSLAIKQKALGTEHPRVATSLNNLAMLYKKQGRYAEAEPLYRRSLSIRQKALGTEHPHVASSFNNLALLQHKQGHYAEAELLYQRSLAITQKVLGTEHPRVAASLNNLAGLYGSQGRYAEAEPLYQRSLAMRQKALGVEHPRVATSLNNLALLYNGQGRYAEAEPLFKRSLAIRQKALGAEHPYVAQSLNNLAGLYKNQSRYAEAEPFFKRSLAIREKALGVEHTEVANSLNNLAFLYKNQGRYAKAEPLFKRSLAIREKALGAEHPRVATSLNNLALLYKDRGRYAEAEPLFKRSLAVRQKALGAEHPYVAGSLNNLAGLYEKQGRYAEALDLSRRATALLTQRFSDTNITQGSGRLSEQREAASKFIFHLSLLEQTPGDVRGESLEVGQLARASDTATQVARMAARHAAGDDALATLVRQRQDLREQLQRLDGALLKAYSKPEAEFAAQSVERLRTQAGALRQAETEMVAQLNAQFPQYQALVSPKPMALEEAQSLLAEHEALIAYLFSEKKGYLWVVRPQDSAFIPLDVDEKEVSAQVQTLREQFDPDTALDEPFNVTLAHTLYQSVFAPALQYLEGVTSLLVVPDGALESLPLGVLVERLPSAPIELIEDHADVQWLAKRYALTTLPAPITLRALRSFAQNESAGGSFTAFGDPLLDGDAGGTRSVDGVALFSRGAIANVNAVRSLTPLPDTADELRALAKTLGGQGKQVLHLGRAATESQVKSIDLKDYRTIAFATHGLMAGEFEGMAEPGLVLTPPPKGTAYDDGLLTASEVSQLELNAQMVLLSACNTASGDGTPGAEGFSGLAKAFFYAGARSLLVSHWAVDSASTVALTVGMFKALGSVPEIGRAEALRRSMLQVMNDAEYPERAHPMFWAPFVLVGEGAGAK